MTTGPASPHLDVLVIGGGQAGLAMGYHLAQTGLQFQIVDSNSEIGGAWRTRWDSLRLFTSGRYDDLPGLPFPADADAYPVKDEVADYLRTYAAKFALPVRLDTTVTSLVRAGDGTYLVKAGADAVEADQVVVATGPFQVPFTPSAAAQLAADVHQLHSADYRRPDALPPGRVLVVGAANSGCQIALELSGTHPVDLAVGKRIPTVPQRPLGRDVWRWASALRLDRVTAESRLGRRLAGRDQIVGIGPGALSKRHGITLRPRVAAVDGPSICFADGTRAAYDVVVWATGFTRDDSWIDVPDATDGQGRLRQSRGITPSPGLYTLGRTWQHTRGSALLGWVGNDAAYLARTITPRAR
ncbi:flavin-containing monooxygenase [Modestobacter altitudinis]|uniref:flavin-containing monooxygenase n=1 Tax=Modestobacter altitudinis TaxID=2213158 RepID=UPI00110D2451|nr:FAD-dependent oxidoreductase [Modestobacter altitudinis]